MARGGGAGGKEGGRGGGRQREREERSRHTSIARREGGAKSQKEVEGEVSEGEMQDRSR